MIPRTPNMTQAIRIGCNAANNNSPICIWPDCSCTQIPAAIHAALQFAIPNVARAAAYETTKELKKSLP